MKTQNQLKKKAADLKVPVLIHVADPSEFFEPLVKRFGEEAPHVVVADPERGPQLYLGNGQLGLTIAGFLQANVDFTSPEAQAMLKEGYKLARPGCYDVAERIKDQEIDGLDGEVVGLGRLENHAE